MVLKVYPLVGEGGIGSLPFAIPSVGGSAGDAPSSRMCVGG